MLKFGLRYITWWHIAKEENFSSLSMNSFTWVFLIPCLGALAESTQETIPIKMWSIKPLSAEKCLNILLIYFIPVDMLINWFTTGIFWTSPNEFCSVKWCHSKSPVYLLRPHQNHSNHWWLYSRNIGLNLLDIIDWFYFVFTNFLWWVRNRFWDCLNKDFLVSR